MSRSKICLLFALVLLISAALVGCGGSENGAVPEGEKEAYVIKMAGSLQEDHPITMGNYKFAELIEEYSDGRITVQVYPNGQLGSNREFYEQCQSGNIQMAEAGAVILANFTDKFKFMQLPFIFEGRESVQSFLNSEAGQAMSLSIAEECGLYPVCYFENGWQALTNSKKEVRVPADLKGMKIRTQENDILLKIYETMGANPMPMAFTELFTAMQQKTVDGQVNPVLVDETGKYDEVQDYLTDINAVYDLASLSINYDFYKSLPEDLQEAVNRAGRDACDYQLAIAAEREEGAYKYMADNGVEVLRLTDEERAAFKESVSSVESWFRDQKIELKLDEYMTNIHEANQKYLDGKLEENTGKDL